jgi:CheY-like chemotaxis protein
MPTRILVVDDDQDTLNLLKLILDIGGYTAITTLNSLDALTIAEAEKPEVVLLDIMMPKLDGFTLCKMMRENPATQNVPIIFVTAYEMLDLEERRAEAGADLCIPKPIEMDVLITTINKALELRKGSPGKLPPGALQAIVPALRPVESVMETLKTRQILAATGPLNEKTVPATDPALPASPPAPDTPPAVEKPHPPGGVGMGG